MGSVRETDVISVPLSALKMWVVINVISIPLPQQMPVEEMSISEERRGSPLCGPSLLSTLSCFLEWIGGEAVIGAQIFACREDQLGHPPSVGSSV